MLEYQNLLLRPRPAAAAPAPEETRAAPMCAVVDPATGQPLGSARWQLPAERSWFAWWSRPGLSVHEAEDEPLVFTVQRRWALTPCWEVCDADGHRIAVVRGLWVLDRFGDCLAWTQPLPDGWQFCGRDGRELARAERSGEDLLLTFAPQLQGEPFLKMALLGAALAGTVGG